MQKLKNSNGLTLLEVIISLAILGIIATAFLSLFGNSFVSIASSGDKSEAVLAASEIMEQVYSNPGNIDSLEGKEFEEKNDYIYKKDVKGFNFHIESGTITVDGNTVSGDNLTLVYFYDNGKKSIELNSFIPGGGS